MGVSIRRHRHFSPVPFSVLSLRASLGLVRGVVCQMGFAECKAECDRGVPMVFAECVAGCRRAVPLGVVQNMHIMLGADLL